MPAGLLDTVPVPVPSFATVRLNVGSRLNVAVTVRAWSIVTVHAPVPVHAPAQPANSNPAEAAGVSVTIVPLAKPAEQVEPQLMPVGLLVTVPVPVPFLLTVRTSPLTRLPASMNTAES